MLVVAESGGVWRAGVDVPGQVHGTGGEAEARMKRMDADMELLGVLQSQVIRWPEGREPD